MRLPLFLVQELMRTLGVRYWCDCLSMTSPTSAGLQAAVPRRRRAAGGPGDGGWESTASRGFDEVLSTIRVRGARVNNLRNVDLDIPKRQLVVFAGVSGSGKSSLAFNTIAAESQRLLNQTYPAFVQSLMTQLPRPDVDSLENLNAAIVVNQEPMGANPRSTVGTATDAWSLLRALFAQHGVPAVPGPRALSFNDAAGMCLDCEGSGQVSALDVSVVVNFSRSLNEGAITFPNFAPGSLFWKVYTRSGHFDNDRAVGKYKPAELEKLLTGTGPNVETGSYPMAYEGVLSKIRRLYLSKPVEALKPRIRAAVEQSATFEPCGGCGGSRLNAAARACTIGKLCISDCHDTQVSDLAVWVASLTFPGPSLLQDQLVAILGDLQRVGLSYLSLSRPTGTLSGGEAQRIRTVQHLDSALTELTYVFDEPAAGLHPHDTARVIELLQALRDKGNTVLVVEHNPDIIDAADHIIELGPRAGIHGGQVVYQGDRAGLARAGTLTGRHLTARQPIKRDVRAPHGTLVIDHATTNNLKNVSIKIPLGVVVAVTGVAGAGKTSLIYGSLPRNEEFTFLDQTPIRGSRRSNTGTYTGLMDTIRADFAKTNGVQAGLFSANSTGACRDCSGLGVTYTETTVAEPVPVTCQSCHGQRFIDEVLQYQLRGRNISEVLAMPIDEAANFFTDPPTHAMLSTLVDVGIGYITLGQPLSTLSGGERQRLRLAIGMRRRAAVYVLDEPANGLHLADIDHLIKLLDRLVDDGASVIVIEHNRDVIARADWVIDLGPGAGHDGGTVVFQGTPAELVKAKTTTGEHLHATHR